MLDLSEIVSFIRTETGVNTLILFMIWMNSRKISKKLDAHTSMLMDPNTGHDVRIKRLENKVFGELQRTT